MTGPVLRAGAWPAIAGIRRVAVVVGGCGAVFPAAAAVLLPICFALLAAVAAFTLDEPASLVVDVTPTGAVRRTAIRAVALLAPLAAGALVMLAAAIRGLALPWASAGLALAGTVLLGFTAACVVRTRTGEPGSAAGAAVVLVLMAPSLVPQVARWVHLPGPQHRRAILGPRVVDRPRRVHGGHHHLGRGAEACAVDVQCSAASGHMV